MLAACLACAAAAQFTVLCAVSASAHHDEHPAAYGPHCFSAVAASWQAQLNAARLAVDQGPCSLAVLHCPLLLCPLTSAAFVLPAGSAAAAAPRAGPLLAGYATSAAAAEGDDSDDEGKLQGNRHGSSSSGGGGTVGGTPSRARSSAGVGASPAPASGLALLAHALSDVVASLGFRPEAFSLGPCSRLVASHMAFVPVLGDAPPAALVLVDRLLDPVSPGLHPDLLVPRMFDTLQLGGFDHANGGRGGDGEVAGGAPGEPAAQGPAGRGSGCSGGLPFAPALFQLRMPSLDPSLAGADPEQSQLEVGSGGSSGGGSSAGGGDASGGPADCEQGPWSPLPGSLQLSGDTQVGSAPLHTSPYAALCLLGPPHARHKPKPTATARTHTHTRVIVARVCRRHAGWNSC